MTTVGPTYIAQTIKITLRLFASYREHVGVSVLEFNIALGSTVGDIARKTVAQYPDIIADPNKLVVAVNEEYQDHEFVLTDEDEVALIPPVSGGLN